MNEIIPVNFPELNQEFLDRVYPTNTWKKTHTKPYHCEISEKWK